MSGSKTQGSPGGTGRKGRPHSFGMVIDLDKCTGCQACVLACKAENNIPPVPPPDGLRGRTISWMEIITEVEGVYPDVRVKFFPRPCLQCDDPPCTRVCPVHATYKDRDGIVAQIYARCIGCRFCVAACPYGVKSFNWYDYRSPEVRRRPPNPDVSTRPKGVVEKCTFCHHRLQKAKERARVENRPLREEDYQPACAESCPAGAIFFGDLNDPDSRVSRLSRSPRAYRLHEELGTQPKVIYLSEEKRHVIE
ncbi:MAG: 4Fe-4S dicluster domain-containing protein [Nitrospinota bacterium]